MNKIPSLKIVGGKRDFSSGAPARAWKGQGEVKTGNSPNPKLPPITPGAPSLTSKNLFSK
ncbi:MAG: hypothetical protein ABSH15_04685 [Verrucomicrobiota bacterium]